MVSYEVSIGFVIITVLLCVGSLNLSAIVDAQDGNWGLFNWFWLPLLPMFVVSSSRRSPRPTGHLRSGGSRIRAGRGLRGRVFIDAVLLFFLGEYIAIAHHVRDGDDPVPRRLAAAVPGPAVHLDPGRIWFLLKCLFIFFLFAMVKAIVPRYRYDQLMRLGWKVFLPLSLAMVAIVAGMLQYTGLTPK